MFLIFMAVPIFISFGCISTLVLMDLGYLLNKFDISILKHTENIFHFTADDSVLHYIPNKAEPSI